MNNTKLFGILLGGILFGMFLVGFTPSFVEANTPPWSVTLTPPGTTTVPVGTSVTLTATTHEVTLSIYWIRISEWGVGIIASCGTGSSCSTVVSSPVAATKIYFAEVEDFGGGDVQATSGSVAVEWTAAGGPPIVTTNPISGSGPTFAALQGSANPNGLSTTAWFRRSTINPGTCNDSFGTRVPLTGAASLGSGTSPVGYGTTALDLSPSTTYFYCAIALNSAGPGFGGIVSFMTTAAALLNPPTLVNPPNAAEFASTGDPDLNSTSITLDWDAPSSGPAPTHYKWEVHQGSQTGPTVAGTPEIVVSFLTQRTIFNGQLGPATYHWRVGSCSNSTCSGTVAWSGFRTFIVNPEPAGGSKPSVNTSVANNILDTSATLHGSVNPNGLLTSARFDWDTTGAFVCDGAGKLTPSDDMGSGFVFLTTFAPISGLSPSTSYSFCLFATNSAGTTLGSVRTFTTAAVGAPTVDLVVGSDPDDVVTASPAPASTEFSWTTTNSPTSCTGSGPPPWPGSKSVTGDTEFIGLVTGGTYTLTCSKAGFPDAVNSVTVTLIAAPGSPTVDLIVNGEVDDDVTVPEPATLTRTWETTNMPAGSTCSAGGSWFGDKATPSGSEPISSLTAGLYNYTLACTKAGFPDAVDIVSLRVTAAGVCTDSAPTDVHVVESCDDAAPGTFDDSCLTGDSVDEWTCNAADTCVGTNTVCPGVEVCSFGICRAVGVEVCIGGADEDSDGLFDCADPDCSADPACIVPPPPACTPASCTAPEICISGVCTPPTAPGDCNGDGTKDAKEQCDKDALGGQTCTTLGFVGPGLKCDSSCNFDTSGCKSPPVVIKFKPPIAATSFSDLINGIINFIFTIAVIVAPILLVIAGVIFMTAAGDPGKVKTARTMLLWTIVGFAIILISKGLVAVLKGILGI